MGGGDHDAGETGSGKQLAVFGFPERPANASYGKDLWVRHLVDFMDAVGVKTAEGKAGGAPALVK